MNTKQGAALKKALETLKGAVKTGEAEHGVVEI